MSHITSTDGSTIAYDLAIARRYVDPDRLSRVGDQAVQALVDAFSTARRRSPVAWTERSGPHAHIAILVEFI